MLFDVQTRCCGKRPRASLPLVRLFRRLNGQQTLRSENEYPPSVALLGVQIEFQPSRDGFARGQFSFGGAPQIEWNQFPRIVGDAQEKTPKEMGTVRLILAFLRFHISPWSDGNSSTGSPCPYPDNHKLSFTEGYPRQENLVSFWLPFSSFCRLGTIY